MTGIPKTARYLLGGLLIGVFWYLNRHRPPWEEALRTIAVFAVLMVALKAKLKRVGIDVHLIPLVASKAVLVIAAAVVEQQLEHSASDPSNVPLFVGLGLAAVVAVLGPVGDRHYFSPTPRKSQSPVTP